MKIMKATLWIAVNVVFFAALVVFLFSLAILTGDTFVTDVSLKAKVLAWWAIAPSSVIVWCLWPLVK